MRYTLSGTAMRGDDYSISGVTSSSGSVSVPANTGSVNIPIVITDDAAPENSETIILTLDRPTNNAGYALGSRSRHTLTVTDNDATGPVLTISGGSAITEGGSAAFTISASPAPSGSITVAYTVTQSGDYVASGSLGAQTVALTGGSAAIAVATVNDSVDETNGSVTVTLNGGTGYTFGTPNAATVAVRDNDPASAATATPTPTPTPTPAAAARQEVNSSPVFVEGDETTRKVGSGLDPGAPVGEPLRARDNDSSVLVWTIRGAAGRSAFSIESGTGQLRTRIVLDREQQDTYRIIVRVRDSDYESDEIAVVISVVDPRELVPTPTPRPTSTPTPTPRPTPTPTPMPTATPTPSPTATPTPTPTPTPAATPTPAPAPVSGTPTPAPASAATPTPAPAATATPDVPSAPSTMTPVPPIADSEDGGVPLWVWLALLLLIAFVAAAIYAYTRSRQGQ